MIKKTNQNGIALAEIMLIISIVTILALLSYPKFNTAMTKAGRDSALVSSDTLVKALSMYKLDKRGYPPANTTVFAIADYTNVTSLQTAFSSLTLLSTTPDLMGGACVHGVSVRVEGEYHIANCMDVSGVNKGGMCCWKDVPTTHDCAISASAPYFDSAKWYECKKKL